MDRATHAISPRLILAPLCLVFYPSADSSQRYRGLALTAHAEHSEKN
jgi:hypothetical protein